MSCFVRPTITLTLLAILSVNVRIGIAQDDSPRQQAIAAMRKAAEFYRHQVASHGGYVYHYSLDLSQRWGEGVATKDQIWIQPPGTPTVGLSYLKAYEATGDQFYLEA